MAHQKPLHVVGAAILDGARCLVARRGPGMRLAGQWEFPGGKVERGERPERALERELREEMGLAAKAGAWLGRGDVFAGGQRVVLDVYEATAGEPPQLREHSEVRWVGEADLYTLDWAAADVPVLPALQARLRGAQQPCSGRLAPVILSADWGKQAAKRAVYSARPKRGWTVAREEPAAGTWDLAGLLSLAERLGAAEQRAVIIGIDAALGFPAGFGSALGAKGFLDGLQHVNARDGLDAESASAEEWTRERPFFRVPPGRGGLNRFVAAAGGRSALLRQIELRTGAKSAFVLSGIPGTVGSGSRELWRELAPLLDPPDRAFGDRAFRVWPFEGEIGPLLEHNATVLAEVYPRASYGVALAPTLPGAPLALAKTKHATRCSALQRLREAQWPRDLSVPLPDLAPAEANEDDFDALMTALALVRLLAEGRPLSGDLVDPRFEGGLLGTGAFSRRPRRPARTRPGP